MDDLMCQIDEYALLERDYHEALHIDVGVEKAERRVEKAEKELRERLREIRAKIEQLDAANKEWHDKTEWLRKDLQPHELGKHLADVLRERCEVLEATVANRHTENEALRSILAGDVVNEMKAHKCGDKNAT